MKKILLIASLISVATIANAQEPEKKKSNKQATESSGQERAINETGISVKSGKGSSSKSKEIKEDKAATTEPKKADKKTEGTKP